MIAVVQCYIGIRKGKEVNILIESPIDIILLKKAYHTASDWMHKNNVDIKMI